VRFDLVLSIHRLNEIAGESIQLLSPLSIAREVMLNGFTAPMLLPIRADPVQLQQEALLLGG
jgi:hypothetical protein